jgi:hypothetical protein
MISPSQLLKLPSTIMAANGVHSIEETLIHWQGALDWLIRAQEINDDDGCAKSYNLAKGHWEPSYPETTGYIIGTMLDAARFTQQTVYIDRAERMGKWLRLRQLDTGAFPALDRVTPIVFDTGQIMHGLIDLAEHGNLDTYSDAIRSASMWLTEIQQDDGSWQRGEYLNIPHAYCTRVAWALLRASVLLNDERFRNGAIRQLNWALACQDGNGWFRQNSLGDQSQPILHTIVYAARGLFEAGMILDEERYRLAAQRTMDFLYTVWEKDGKFYGAYDRNWKGTVKARCLVGEAQASVLWMKMSRFWGDSRYRSAALSINRSLKQTQDLATPHSGLHGGIPGSYPITGRYCFLKYPNWAAKFYADALLMEMLADS